MLERLALRASGEGGLRPRRYIPPISFSANFSYSEDVAAATQWSQYCAQTDFHGYNEVRVSYKKYHSCSPGTRKARTVGLAR